MAAISAARGALLAVTSFLACWSGGAFGAEPKMPKDLRGTWCAVGDTGRSPSIYRRCRQYGGEQDWIVDARGMSNGEVGCKPRSIVLDGNGYRINMRCVNYVGSSRDESRTSERWRLFNNGRRLEMREN
jgi:hypothetical protein